MRSFYAACVLYLIGLILALLKINWLIYGPICAIAFGFLVHWLCAPPNEGDPMDISTRRR
jgi:hypothetical protein